MPSLSELRLADLLTLLAVENRGTISGAARELRVTPSQVSKAISRLERQFGVRLLSRGALGVAPTPEARRMLPGIASAVDALQALSGAHEPGQDIELTVAGPSYVVARVLPAIAALLPAARVRGLELAPAQMRACIAENVFDVAFAPGGIRGQPASWTTDTAGELRAALLCRPSFVQTLGPLPLSPEQVHGLPFVGPATVIPDRLAAVADDCPLPVGERKIAYEVQTIGAALEVVARIDLVVFGPVLAAQRLLEDGSVVELPVAGWDVRQPLHVLCNGDRVRARVRTAVIEAARRLGGE